MDKKLEARITRLENILNEAILERRVSKLESSIDKYLDDPRFDDVMAKARAAKAANYHANDIDGCPPGLQRNEYIYAWVIRNCDVDQLQKVIDSGVNVNKRQMSDPWGGCTPLMIAAGLNKTAMVKMLLDSGAKINLVSDNRDGKTALMYCLAHGFRNNTDVTKTVKLLLSNGANPNKKDKYDITPISVANRMGDKKLISMLLDAGAKE